MPGIESISQMVESGRCADPPVGRTRPAASRTVRPGLVLRPGVLTFSEDRFRKEVAVLLQSNRNLHLQAGQISGAAQK